MKLYIRTANAAFAQHGKAQELARILTLLARQVEARGEIAAQAECRLLAINGDRVGTANPFGSDVAPEPGLFMLRIDIRQDAFAGPNYCREVGRILRAAAVQVKAGATELILRDSNGNKVGTAVDTPAPHEVEASSDDLPVDERAEP